MQPAKYVKFREEKFGGVLFETLRKGLHVEPHGDGRGAESRHAAANTWQLLSMSHA